MIQNTLASGWMISLKELIIDDWFTIVDEHIGDGLNNFLRALETSTPHLETFRWTTQCLYHDDKDDENYVRFDTQEFQAPP
jgi:hypothetical protein